MIRVLAADDEPFARARLVRLLRREAVEVVGVCRNGEEAVRAIAAERPDLVLLDVQMPGMSGFDVVREVGPAAVPMVVFVTAHDRYALQAFEVNAVDYLLKPVHPDRFHAAVARARDRLEAGGRLQHARQLAALLATVAGQVGAAVAEPPPPAPADHLEWLFVRKGERVLTLRVDDVDWMGAEDNYVRLHVGKESHLIRERMQALEERLDPRRFARIHRSTIVNLERVRELRPWSSGEFLVILRDGRELRLSRRYRGKLGFPIGQYL
ncbi:MAG TPA: LytTR family DNA-binding domain-containing protein [Longimicrobiaceae bacterium]